MTESTRIACLESELAEAKRRLANGDRCNTCGGDGKTTHGGPCICGGSGRAQDELLNMRLALLDADERSPCGPPPVLAVERRVLDAAIAWGESCEEDGGDEDIVLADAVEALLATRAPDVVPAHKFAALVAELKEETSRREAAESKLRLVATSTENVWRWQGDGSDQPESLSCPVVMSADALRTLLAGRDRTSEIVFYLRDAPQGIFTALYPKPEDRIDLDWWPVYGWGFEDHPFKTMASAINSSPRDLVNYLAGRVEEKWGPKLTDEIEREAHLPGLPHGACPRCHAPTGSACAAVTSDEGAIGQPIGHAHKERAETAAQGGWSETIFSCRTCPAYTYGRNDGTFAKPGWKRIKHIDGPNAICPLCLMNPDAALAELRDEYPNARIAE